MPVLTEREKELLAPLISPYEESAKTDEQKSPQEGESDRSAFEDLIHDAANNSKPTHRYAELTPEETDQLRREGRCPEKCFLWVIDETSIKIIREKTPNPARTLKQEYVCHTNLTGWGKAFAGGELFFGRAGEVYINPFSDRYGGERLFHGKRWPTVVRYFRRVGYKNLVDIIELLAAESES